MEIIDLNRDEIKSYNTAVALGNFDGIHIGHQYLIKDNIDKARERNLKSAVLLFKNHTRMLLDSKENSNIKILTSYDQKLKFLKSLGVDLVYVIDFNESLMRLSPEEFVNDILLKMVNAKLVTVGFNYRFGFKASGDSKYLERIGKLKGFEVNIISPVYVENSVVSSTVIRNLIRSGNINKANKFLGRDYTIIGTVVKGDGRGRKLGFPTANMKLIDNYVIPKTGVYRTSTVINGVKYMSLTDIGYNPTFDEEKLKIETYIDNFNGNIYDNTIEVSFIEFIRDDIKFNRAEELIEKIKEDVNYIKNYQ